jgi:peptidoglycan/xylan/chitin deacetylase (PgdA/CDA1 family)
MTLEEEAKRYAKEKGYVAAMTLVQQLDWLLSTYVPDKEQLDRLEKQHGRLTTIIFARDCVHLLPRVLRYLKETGK